MTDHNKEYQAKRLRENNKIPSIHEIILEKLESAGEELKFEEILDYVGLKTGTGVDDSIIGVVSGALGKFNGEKVNNTRQGYWQIIK